MNEKPGSPNEVEVRSDYLRARNCAIYQGSFGPLIEDMFLHLLQNGQKLEPAQAEILRDGLIAGTLHHAARPRDEMTAWTVNLTDPPLNLFVTGDSENGTVTGRVFTQNVKKGDHARMYAQISRPRFPLRESIVSVEGHDPFAFVETYYRNSEQRPARLFRLEGDTAAMVVAQPGWDGAWFDAIGPAEVISIPEKEPLGPLERRRFHFGCGCEINVIRRILRDACKGDLEGLFGSEEALRVECPRCAGVFHVTRAEMERFLES